MSSVFYGQASTENHESMSALSRNGSNSLSHKTTPLANSSRVGSERSKKKLKPPGTLEYDVESNDTIEKIALKWNTVPSEIQHLNRLVTRVVFPGQVLYVPDPNYTSPPHPSSSPFKTKLTDSIIKELNTLEEPEILPNNSQSSPGINLLKTSLHSTLTPKPGSASLTPFFFHFWKTTPNSKPGHVELQKQKCLSEPSKNSNENLHRNKLVSRHTLTEEEAKKLDEECTQRFLKVNCKIVTRSKGCYNGVLI
ncbi:oxidation resistance 1, partial [Brachionus plicatilis]